MKKIVINLDEFPDEYSLVKNKERLWLIFKMPDKTGMIQVFDSASGELLLDTDQFITEHSELKPGIAAISYNNMRNILEIVTKDGRNLVYLLDDDSLIPDTPDVVNEKIVKHYRNQGLTNLFMLVNESSDNRSRKMLYKISGQVAALYQEHVLPYFQSDTTVIKDINHLAEKKFESRRLTPEDIYLEPILVYQDNDMVVILHQDQIGADAKRMLTCVNSEGTKWTISPYDLFPEMMRKKSDPFSDKFFMECKVRGDKLAKTFVLEVKECGLMGFDADSGAKLWILKSD